MQLLEKKKYPLPVVFTYFCSAIQVCSKSLHTCNCTHCFRIRSLHYINVFHRNSSLHNDVQNKDIHMFCCSLSNNIQDHILFIINQMKSYQQKTVRCSEIKQKRFDEIIRGT